MTNIFRSVIPLLVLSATAMSASGCAWFQAAPEAPLKQATVEQLTGQLQERKAAIQTMKGLFRAQISGSGIPIAQRVEGAVYYRRPEALRLQGFNHLGGKLFEFRQNKTHFRLELPAEGKRYAGSLEELQRAKIGRILQLSRWAVGGVVGGDSSPGGSRAVLSEDGDRYRLDVFQSGPDGRMLRRLWFERHSLQVVQEERMRENGEVEASMTFEDYRGIPAAPVAVVDKSARATLMPFKVTVEDRVESGSMVLTFHEIVLNPTLKPEELAHIIPERFYCNRRDAATTSLAASSTRPAGRLAPRDLDVLFQARLGLSELHVPVSRRVLSVSSRTVMNDVGLPGRQAGEGTA